MKNETKSKIRKTTLPVIKADPNDTFDIDSYRRLSAQIGSILESQSKLFSPINNSLELYKTELFQPSKAVFEAIQEATRPSKALLESIALMTSPSKVLLESIAEMTKPQKILIDSIQESIKSIAEPFSKIDFTSYLSSISEIQLSLATNLVIKTELLKPFEGISNGISTNTAVIDKRLINNEEIGLRVQKNTATISAQIQYKKIEMIDAKLSIFDSRIENVQSNLEELKLQYGSISNILREVEDDPFRFFKVKSFDFVKSGSIFIVNGVRQIHLESKTIQDYICQVLFSGKKRLDEEWYWSDILDIMTSEFVYEGNNEMTWKSMQDAISKINTKIATETTIKDAILIPRTEIVQLNPLYFHN